MLKRILTAVVLVPVLAVLLLFGGIPLGVGMLVISVVGMTEFYEAMSNRHLSVHYLGYVFALAYYVLLMMTRVPQSYFYILVTLLIMSVTVVMVFNNRKVTIVDCVVTVFGFFYVAFLMSFIFRVRMHPYGSYMVWMIFICAFGTDTFAYLVGRAWGRHQLVPALSPKKTVEGVIGGVVGASLLAAVFGVLMSQLFHVEMNRLVLRCLVVGVAGAVLSIFGDLTASAIKRQTGIKDFGKLLPGHGGVLDRFDSVLFTAPMIYMVVTLLMKGNT